jgi:hypothetical protein
MSERDEEVRFEQELREVLRRRDPGPAPYGLRGRVDRIPDDVPVTSGLRGTLVRLAPTLAAVAVLAMLVVTISGTLGRSPGPTVGSGPESSAPPTVPFDPTLTGPGVLAEPDNGPAGFIAVAVILLGIGALLLPRRRRVIPIALAAALVVYAVVASLVPVTLGTNGYGQGLATKMVVSPPGFEEQVIYEVAAARQPFSVAALVHSDSVVPVTLDGIVEPELREPSWGGLTWNAVWLDEDATPGGGGIVGPARPFASSVLEPGDFATLWLVGRAGSCAYGPAFDTAAPPGNLGYTTTDTVRMQVRTLGWPRTIEVTLPFRLVEPSGTCPAPTDAPVNP